MSKIVRPFHLAFPIYDIKLTIHWYQNTLGCKIGRQDKNWVDFNFFGHQIVAHLVKDYDQDLGTNSVDGDKVPIRHFGIVLTMGDWEKLAVKLTELDVAFIVEPHVRFKGLAGEQATMFVKDFSNNALEFKAFKEQTDLFTR